MNVSLRNNLQNSLSTGIRPVPLEGARKTRRIFTPWCMPTLLLHWFSLIGSQIIFEALTALILGILGASLNAPYLKDITWQSEMKQQYVSPSISQTWFEILKPVFQNDRRYGFTHGFREFRKPGQGACFKYEERMNGPASTYNDIIFSYDPLAPFFSWYDFNLAPAQDQHYFDKGLEQNAYRL